MERVIPEELDRLGRQQYGLVTGGQSRQVWSPSTVRKRRRQGVLIAAAPDVDRLVGSPQSWRQRALAACLALGEPVALSGLAAAYLWRVEAVARPALQVTVPRRRRPRASVAASVRRQHLPAMDITRWERIPVTTPVRTVLDLSSLVGVPLLERVVDDLARRRLLTVEELDARLSSDQPLPRVNRTALQTVLRPRRQRGIGESPREDWVVNTLVEAGLPVPERNVMVELDGRLRQFDCAYPAAKVAIEYDGWATHGDRRHFDGDRDKSAALQLEGWIGLQVTSSWTKETLVRRVRWALSRQCDDRQQHQHEAAAPA